ncbi:endonuclease V [Actinopolymorpha pittospori]|uniref:endonuclease V n=1 Tax=Actinopolymorpha pittospori TaxID=648752 RepID=UPI003B587C2F
MTVGAVDVHYDDMGGTKAALVVCGEPSFSTVKSEHVADISRTVPYESGALFKRQLPCIQAVLALGPPLELLVIDGHATLDPQGRPGLGAHAAEALDAPMFVKPLMEVGFGRDLGGLVAAGWCRSRGRCSASGSG